MPKLDRIPKDALWLSADSLDDYMDTKKRWELNGWLISTSTNNGVMICYALKDSKVLVLGWQEPSLMPTPEPEPVVVEEQPLTEEQQIEKEEADATAEAHERLSSIS